MNSTKWGVGLLATAMPLLGAARQLPADFVELKQVAPTIRYEIRYAGAHNFLGRPVAGYGAARCLLTKKAALALANVQNVLQKSGLSLMVYDCYRPQQAVDDFIGWSQRPHQQSMKAEFYPRVEKQDFFKLGYVAERSGHSRGSTVDLTITPAAVLQASPYRRGQTLVACFAPYLKRFKDGSIDMGTGFDCMDKRSHPNNQQVGLVAYQHRQLLAKLMQQHGFQPYEKEWWHFTLKNEPYPNTYFNVAMK